MWPQRFFSIRRIVGQMSWLLDHTSKPVRQTPPVENLKSAADLRSGADNGRASLRPCQFRAVAAPYLSAAESSQAPAEIAKGESLDRTSLSNRGNVQFDQCLSSTEIIR